MRSVHFLVLLFAVSVSSQAQWKTQTRDEVPVGESLVRTDGGGLLFGWFDPSRFTMGHSYSLSYTTARDMGYSLGEYTNSMQYQISDPLSIRLDLSLSHSPFDSYGGKLGQELSGFRVKRAELNYRPSENTFLQIQFRQVPASRYMMGFDSPYQSGLWRDEVLEPYR